MARHLWLLRHGEAVPHDAADVDDDRALTARGREQAVAAGRAIARLGAPVHLCFASPKRRAWDTAVLACQALGLDPVEHAPLRAGFDAEEALALVHAAGEDQRVLLTGHEPDLSQVVLDLTGARTKLRKGGLAGVALDGHRGTLELLLRPIDLAAIADG